ncbi:MAG: LL-diaminopimelate aminotransferase [Terriglobia bacterium]
MKVAKRIDNLPPYLFAEIDKKIAGKKAQGIDVISLGIGDPVEPTPEHVVNRLCAEAKKVQNQRYPSYYGLPAFREAVARWYKRRFNVDLDPDKEVLPLIGSKEGLAHIYTALVDNQGTCLVSDPGYPVYTTGAVLAEANVEYVPLEAANGFNPDLARIDEQVAQAASLMWLNYPNNPTAAIANEGLFEEVVTFAKRNDVVICHDNPYSEITFDGYVAPSILETPGARDVAVEFNSLSKTFNMTGWRIGFVVGNAEVIEALGRVKTNVDSGIFNAVQFAGVEALDGPWDCVEEMRRIYRGRRDKVVSALKSLGLEVESPKATIYVWVKVPPGENSETFSTAILEKANVVVSPGHAYGPTGADFIRLSLTIKDDRLEEALERIGKTL